ncbi:transcription factor bHLH115-like [Glycine soja]|uniref:Transcription factor bHLH115 isoform A n=1 Tax=Glycine soja TaxID=3848 RepID=A0A445IC94_GLYSO|nr:transcription factor bHLH115-like [Glycine soja]RZB83636.1 Transcription factor bHLH115 isoform A [Glycine soja]RZB83637.1 Transcription factor bHLH115 isoform B [Glycine soja]
MDVNSSGGASDWLYDYGFDIPVAGSDFMASDSGGFRWGPQSHNFKGPSNMSLEMEYSLDSAVMENGPSKRLRTESCASGSKACREKLRRDKLNERFLELSSILEPSRQPKSDKVAILSDAARVVIQLRNEAKRLKEMNDELQAKVKELKGEKNELRDEKNRLKEEKEKLEQQVKVANIQPSFLPQAPDAKGQVGSHKLIPFIGYPGIAMWQFMSPAAVDTSKDHLLRPPVA